MNLYKMPPKRKTPKRKTPKRKTPKQTQRVIEKFKKKEAKCPSCKRRKVAHKTMMRNCLVEIEPRIQTDVFEAS